MSVSVIVNGLTLCHKGDSQGTSVATLPDVCKTPTPAGPTPLPYPNVSFATDLANGTTTVKVDGGHMAAHADSEFSKSTGDEPGSLGGIKSGKNRAKSTWLTSSPDVFLEGKAACRLTDKMLMNDANSADMAGFITEWLKAAKKGEPDCEALVKEIDRVLNGNKDSGSSPDRGLKERYFDQLNGKGAPGTEVWDGHQQAFMNTRQQLQDLLEAWRNFCGGGGHPVPSDVWEWAYKKIPQTKDYVGPQAKSSSGWSVAGWGVAAIGLSVLTVVAVICPFDGPVGDVAAGTAAAGAWARLFTAAAAL